MPSPADLRPSGWAQITEPEDPRLSDLADLRTRERRPGAPLVAEGALVVARALQGPCRVRAVVGTASQLARLDRADLPPQVFETTATVLRAAMGFDFHRGVVALVERPAPRPDRAARVLARDAWTVLLVERLADPANVGALIRTAAALGTDLVVCDAGGADPYERRALRASMGHALLSPPWVAESLCEVVSQMRGQGAQILAAALGGGARPLAGVRRGPKLAVMVGNEGAGLSDRLAALATGGVTIPVVPGTDSLNVAAATAILLYTLR